MDDAALNFNELAGCDDESCIYEGCTYNLACNYDPIASVDDGSCEFGTCPGCTDPMACNFNPTLTEDDGSCTFGVCGCNLPYACNYDEEATANDGSCDFLSCDVSFEFEFNNCGQEGRFGPNQSQCDAEYGAGVVVTESGIQKWTVPVSGTYTIVTAGAKGGDGTEDSGSNGGLGAIMSGEFDLTSGTILNIVVGQMGQTAGGGGGGGGSFVWTNTDELLLAAGGGGGGGDQNQSGNFTGQAGNVALNGTSSGNGSGSGGINGNGGASGNSGGGGAGWLSDGNPGSEETTKGLTRINGFLGGVHSSGVQGGFGGGGSNGAGDAEGGGGGGGYSGGGGGDSGNDDGGGGGGSYNSGANQVNTSGINAGQGSVTITLISAE